MLRVLRCGLHQGFKSQLQLSCRSGSLVLGSSSGQGVGDKQHPPSRWTGSRSFHVLGIETSCDDSAIAIVNSETNEVVFQRLASQWAEHAPHGGIVPSLAVRAHDKNVPVLLQDMKDKGFASLIDAVAVTRGPGIKPCLSIGLSAAQKLAEELDKPLVMVNHLQGHALVALLESDAPVKASLLTAANSNVPTTHDSGCTDSSVTDDDAALTAANNGVPTTPDGGCTDSSVTDHDAALTYPFLSLVVSGGHSLLVLVEAYDSFRLLGSTLDDSVGEAFDKVARLLQLASQENITNNNCADHQEGREPAVVARHGGALVEAAAAKSQNHVGSHSTSFAVLGLQSALALCSSKSDLRGKKKIKLCVLLTNTSRHISLCRYRWYEDKTVISRLQDSRRPFGTL